MKINFMRETGVLSTIIRSFFLQKTEVFRTKKLRELSSLQYMHADSQGVLSIYSAVKIVTYISSIYND